MKIDRIDTFVVESPLELGFYFSQWEYATRRVCLVRVTADTGLYGWGEGYGPADVVQASARFLGAFVVGQPVLESETCWQIMHRRSLDYARSGAMLAGLSAIDIAIWDLKGKQLGLPIHTLLGGKKQSRIRPYATGLYFSEGEGQESRLVDEALAYKQMGLSAIKMKVGLGIDLDLRHARAVREAIGPGIQLAVDANHAYSPREALALCERLEELDIAWFEEPISPELYGEYRRLRAATAIPIAGGECEYLRHGFLRLFQAGSVDIAQPDVAAAGGITELKKIFAMAETFGIEVVPHSWGTGISLSAAMHLLANLDIAPGRMRQPLPLMELDRSENPLRDRMVWPAIVPEQGQVTVPDGPGLGVDVDMEVLKEFRVG